MNDMMEIKIDGQIASGQMSGDFETLLKDTRKILTTIYHSIKKRDPENAEKHLAVWRGLVYLHTATIETDQVEELYGNVTEVSAEEVAARAMKDIFKGPLKDLF